MGGGGSFSVTRSRCSNVKATGVAQADWTRISMMKACNKEGETPSRHAKQQ